MNTFYLQHRAVARVWAVLTMFAVLLSAFTAPLSVAFAQELPTEPVAEASAIVDDTTEDDEEGEESFEDDEESTEEGEENLDETTKSTEDETEGVLETPEEGLFMFARGWQNNNKVDICHSNKSNPNANNPFTENEVSENGLNGHDDHGDDIIPVTEDFPTGQNLGTVYQQFNGMTGQQILDNDCRIPKVAKISITKIVCEDEASLPNGTYSEITAGTAASFLAQHQGDCSPVEDFKFQWAKGGQNIVNDNTGALGSPWVTSDYTDANGNVVITLSENIVGNKPTISVREVWSDDYIPFTGQNGSNVSAEIYCADDAAGYDNLEWIPKVQVDNTYHCVAWNVAEEPDPVACELVIKSDADDLVVEKNAYAKVLSTLHGSWVNSLPNPLAKWIWGDDPVALPTTQAETQTFKKSFVWNGLTVDSAALTLASDNSHAITLGSFSDGDAGEFNYGATKSYDVETAIVNGLNTLTVEVENFALANSNASNNPAGLIYELKIKGTGTTEDCGEVVPELPEEPKVSTVTMCKFNGNEQALSGWNLMLLGDDVETVEVSATNGTGATVALNTGSYVAVASGTWDNNRGPLNIVDAEYSTEDNWVTQMDGFTGYGTDILELQLNGVTDPNSNWGVYNSGHEYARGFNQTATGSATFAIYDTFYGDNTGSLDVTVYEGYASTTNQNGCVTFTNVPFGKYTVDEIMKDGWQNVSGLGAVTVDSETENFTVVNRPIDIPTEPVATVIAHKIVCTDETELPNWGAVEGHTISSTTAQTWVDTHASCEFESNWQFEWAGQSASNPDNNLPTTAFYGAAGGDWTLLPSTDVNGKTQVQLTAAQIAGMSNIWMREVLKDGYIPFTYGPTNMTNANNVTAEMYCHTDVFNYDNYDRVDGIAVNNTYNCVAWNHTPEPAPICEARVNLLANADFESPEVTNAAGWDIFNLSTYPALAWAVNWMNGTGAPAEASLELHEGVNGWLPAGGDQHAELDSDWQGPDGTSGEAASVAISQTVSTVAGADYSLSWKFSPRPGTAADQNVLQVLVNNIVVATNTAAGGANTAWTADNYVFEGTGAPVTVTFRDAGISNSEGTFVDDVSLNCRPDENGGGDNDDTYRLEGSVWHDENENSEWEEEGENSELPLAGWTVKATNGIVTHTTTTDAFGDYSFEVTAGTWTVYQIVPEGWDQITSPEEYVVTVPDDLFTQTLVEKVFAYLVPVAHAAVMGTIDDLDFGNNESEVITTPNNPSSSRSGGGGRRATPTVAGDSISAPGLMPLVLGEQVTAVPYGAPGTGHGGSAAASGLTLLQLLFMQRRKDVA